MADLNQSNEAILKAPHKKDAEITPKIVRFLDSEVRSKSSFSISSEYPSLFAEYPGGESLYIEKEGNPISHVGYVAREFQHQTFRMKIGLIGSVVTASSHRGRGYASRLVKQSLVELKKRGCLIAVLWSDTKDFFAPMGFERMGREADFRFSPEHMPEKVGVVREMVFEKDAHLTWRLYQKHSLRLDRSLEEHKKLLKIPNSRVFVTELNGQVTSYLVINKGLDFTDYIHEWGGELSELQRNIAYCQRVVFPNNPLTLIAPLDYDMTPVKQISIERWEGVLGLMRLLDRNLLLSTYMAFLKSKQIEHVWSKEKDTILFTDTEFQLKTDKDVLALVFGDDTHKQHPVLPFFLWGFDSI